MSERTLEASEVAAGLRKPSFELQQAALKAGFGSVRDWMLAQCIDEIRVLKLRVEQLELESDRLAAECGMFGAQG